MKHYKHMAATATFALQSLYCGSGFIYSKLSVVTSGIVTLQYFGHLA